jgi:biotin operon repressor
MSERQIAIFEMLKTGAFSARVLAAHIGAPVPSVRRDIVALRDDGFDIITDRRNGYVLKSETRGF